jgi:hypothetical protein
MTTPHSSGSDNSSKPRLFDRLGRPIKHGMCKTPEYKVWQQLRDRCCNVNSQRYNRYGGRGITFCDRWKSFDAFLKDMGTRPGPSYSIDRIDNDGHYCPTNCRWATRAEQNRNRSDNVKLSLGGLTLTQAEWSARTGIRPKTIECRLKNGWSVEDALTKPVERRNYVKMRVRCGSTNLSDGPVIRDSAKAKAGRASAAMKNSCRRRDEVLAKIDASKGEKT